MYYRLHSHNIRTKYTKIFAKSLNEHKSLLLHDYACAWCQTRKKKRGTLTTALYTFVVRILRVLDIVDAS